MATTGQNFVKLVNPAIVNGTYQAAGTIASYLPVDATSIVNSGAATTLDTIGAGMSNDGFAKHGFSTTTLSGTTPVNLSLIDLTSNSTASCGDTVFATWNTLELINTGAADLTVAPGASNPANLGMGGTTPTLTIPANSKMTFHNLAGGSIDGTHKIVTVTPTAGGSFALGVAGA